MKAYWSDGRGRYGTGEDYDYFYQSEDDENWEIFTSSDGLWTYHMLENGIELIRYNGSEINILVPSVVDGMKVTSLDSTFDGFYELESAEIPEGVESIIGAFYGCESLKRVGLPQGLENVSYAFNSCFSLKNISIPSSVKDFSYAFSETAIESFEFPQGTTNIERSFSDCQCLKKVKIPKSVIMSSEAFADCEVLESVELEDGIQKLDDYVFFHCLSLKELKIPESVTEFGEQSVGMMEVREYIGDKNADIRGYRIKDECIVPSFKIIGVKGSAAEEYANENNITFVNDAS